MPKHTDTADTPGKDNTGTATTTRETGKETRLNRIANEVAGHAAKRVKRYDRKHQIFTT